jgi:hypothetical protein
MGGPGSWTPESLFTEKIKEISVAPLAPPVICLANHGR